jgi:cobalamin biosynthesis protein CbiG
MSKKLDILLARIQNGEKIPPMVVSTQDAIYIVSTLKNAHIETLESL